RRLIPVGPPSIDPGLFIVPVLAVLRRRLPCNPASPKTVLSRAVPHSRYGVGGAILWLISHWSMIFSENRQPTLGSSPRACFSGSCSHAKRPRHLRRGLVSPVPRKFLAD